MRAKTENEFRTANQALRLRQAAIKQALRLRQPEPLGLVVRRYLQNIPGPQKAATKNERTFL